MPTLSKRLSEGGESLIGKTFELALKLQAAGRTIHDLSKGEPDFPTDPHVAEAGRQAIARGFTNTATDGDGRTKQAIRERLQAPGTATMTTPRSLSATAEWRCWDTSA